MLHVNGKRGSEVLACNEAKRRRLINKKDRSTISMFDENFKLKMGVKLNNMSSVSNIGNLNNTKINGMNNMNSMNEMTNMNNMNDGSDFNGGSKSRVLSSMNTVLSNTRNASCETNVSNTSNRSSVITPETQSTGAELEVKTMRQEARRKKSTSNGTQDKADLDSPKKQFASAVYQVTGYHKHSPDPGTACYVLFCFVWICLDLFFFFGDIIVFLYLHCCCWDCFFR